MKINSDFLVFIKMCSPESGLFYGDTILLGLQQRKNHAKRLIHFVVKHKIFEQMLDLNVALKCY